MSHPAASAPWRAALPGLLLLLVAGAGCGEEDQVLIIGHRGSPREITENSVAGFKLAHELGADGIELDVQVTADGEVVVMHDDTLDRTTTCKGEVVDYTLAMLASCQLNNGEPIRTLDQVMQQIGDLFLAIFVEIKVSELRVPPEQTLLALADATIDIVKASGYASTSIIISYDPTVLKRVGARQPEGIIGGWDDADDEGVAKAKRWGLDWVLMPLRTVNPTIGAIADGLGKPIAVYGVNSPTDFMRAQRAGVEAMMSDSIRTLCSLLGRRPKR